jgi:arginase
MRHNIQILSAPSILGLKPSGVELLSKSLLAEGLIDSLQSAYPVVNIPTQNESYSFERDEKTKCLNPSLIHDFSLLLLEQISRQFRNGTFPLVLGGDCSILLGIMPAMKKEGAFGLIFLDAHGDFYEPSQSTTGEVADMDLAIVTGRGPDILTNVGGLKPYVKDEHVIHIGQRDAEEAKKFGSQDIKDTAIKCFDLNCIQLEGLNKILDEILVSVNAVDINGFWLHFDTDVLSDDENPAVDYRLAGGLTVKESEYLLRKLIETGKIVGMSVTIFNPKLDTEGEIAAKIASCINKAFFPNSR